jgi:cyclin-D1-binding protein 1
LNALAVTSQTISEAITSLSSPVSASVLAEPTPAITDLNNDLQSLLSLLYSATTRATLVLKPVDPHYKAALSPLSDLATNGTRLAHIGTLFRAPDSTHGETLAKEVVAAIQEVLDALLSYLKVLISEHTSALRRSSKGEGEEYMLRAGAVHEVIMRLKDGLSKDNRTAVKKKWKADRGLLEDAVKEVGEMLEDQDGEGGDEDDGWDELGLGSTKMQEDEIKRAKSVCASLWALFQTRERY